MTRVLVAAGLLGLVCAVVATPPAAAQTREKGPWWPHPIWGPEDQAGGSNWITPDKVKEAVSLVKTGKVYELGQVGTQFDGPGHVGKRMTMADGSTTDVYYNGVPSSEMHDPYGLARLGVEKVKPFITRGLLVDVAGYKEVETLPSGYEVTLADLRGALSRQQMTESDIKPGDALLFNFGWWRLWPDPARVNAPGPGVGREVAAWIVERKVSMVGSDATTDVAMAVHEEATLRNGIFNLEWMRFDELLADRVHEFLFVFTPLRLKGATGSPGRPLAIR